MKTLTIKNLPADVAEALERETRRRGSSLDRTVIDLLIRGLGVGAVRSNGLGRLGGNWSEEEFEEFERAVSPFEQLDEELLR